MDNKNNNIAGEHPENGQAGIPQAEEQENINRHTEDIQDIITKVPHWIIRWGITVFMGILLMIISISIFVRYPDTLKTTIKIESSANSTAVVSTVAGRISKVYVKKGALVKKGDTLVSIENAANPAKQIALVAPANGKVGLMAIVVPGYYLPAGQEVFTIHPATENLFGTITISQSYINKIKEGQEVLINLDNFPSDEYGQLKGRISYVADEPVKEGVFNLKVTIDNSGLRKPILLKSWMRGNAEIITEDVSLQARVYKTILKGI